MVTIRGCSDRANPTPHTLIFETDNETQSHTRALRQNEVVQLEFETQGRYLTARLEREESEAIRMLNGQLLPAWVCLDSMTARGMKSSSRVYLSTSCIIGNDIYNCVDGEQTLYVDPPERGKKLFFLTMSANKI